MFKQAIRGMAIFPNYLSSDHDPLYRFHQWEANLRILGIRGIKTVPDVPWSHPFIERLIGTLRRDCLDRLLFWTATDLDMKLVAFQDFYNKHRTHSVLGGTNADPRSEVQTGRLEEFSLADTLSWVIPNANRGMSRNSPATPSADCADWQFYGEDQGSRRFLLIAHRLPVRSISWTVYSAM